MFDEIRAGVLADRSQFFKDLSAPFYGANRPGAKVSQGLRDSFWLQGMQAGFKGVIDCIKAFSETDFTEDLKKFDVPTLIMHGDDDQIVPIGASAHALVQARQGRDAEGLSGLAARPVLDAQGPGQRGPARVPQGLSDRELGYTGDARTRGGSMIAAHKRASKAAKWAAIKACRIVGARQTADILYVRRLEGYLSAPKIRLLYRIVTGLSGPGEIAEIGSWKGKSTVALSLAAKRARRGETVYAIDHHLGIAEDTGRGTRTALGSTWSAFLSVIAEAGVDDIVKPLRMTSLAGARWLKRRGVRLKFLLVDGAHDEEGVTKDLDAFFPLVLPGGLIALDDAKPDGYCPGVYAAYQKVIADRTQPIEWAGTLFLVQKSSADPV